MPMAKRISESLLRQELFRFGHGLSERWTVADALEGTQVFGATGSGKSTGSGARLARAFLERGFGGLVLISKQNDLRQWADYFKASKRPLSDITVIQPAGPLASGVDWPSEFTGKVRVAS